MTRKEHRETPLFLSSKEALILDQLLAHSSKSMYGLELVKESNGKLKRGTVYVTLTRMEDKGYIKSSDEDSPGGPRRVYSPTGYGQKIFEASQMASQARDLLWEGGS